MKNVFLVLFCVVLPMTQLVAQSASSPALTSKIVLTPAPLPQPRLNNPKVFGVRPGSPFLYTIPATGERPLTFAASALPEGLVLDVATGRITGTLSKPGEYKVTLKATNAKGAAEKAFRIVVGDNINLTPPMGWNSWNCWGGAVSQEKVLSSARAMVEKGLKDHGWTYINIDDGWQGKRGGQDKAIQPNSKFPDMKGLGDSIHALGLKFGIYSTPWRGSYEGHIGSSCDNADGTYDWIESGDHNEFMRIGNTSPAFTQASGGAQNEALRNKSKEGSDVMAKRKSNWKFGANSFAIQDAKQWAAWGVDYLKYDWNPIDGPHTTAMRDALLATKRDITYSLSNSASFNQAADWVKLANCWRTTGDINDSWKSLSGIGFNQERWTPFAGPGHWNDPDMLVVGKVGWGPKLHDSKLTPDEQYTHISLWCLLSAPLLIGCDIAAMDEFTLGLLTNDEVLEINQDSLGAQGHCVSSKDNLDVYVKSLEDGTVAVGLFNRGDVEATITASWKDLGVKGTQRVRDLWRQKDRGVVNEKFESTVSPHGVVLVRLFPNP
jgi:alpha-galactosidase